MDDYKNSDNFQRTEGCKMISPHHFHHIKTLGFLWRFKREGYVIAEMEFESPLQDWVE